MSIWFSVRTIRDVIQFIKLGRAMKFAKGLEEKTLVDNLGIEFIEIGEDYLKGTMPVDQRTIQPLGILHGGASCVLADTVGGLAANLCLNPITHYAVALDLHTTHIRSVKSGIVTATAKPIHRGKSTHVWEIKLVNEEDNLVSITRLTTFVKEWA